MRRAGSDDQSTHSVFQSGSDMLRDGISAIAQMAGHFQAADWERPTACEGWSAVDLAGHVLTVADLWHHLVDRMERGETSPPFGWEDFAVKNAGALAALTPSSGPVRIEAFADRAHRWVERVSHLEPDQPFGCPVQTIAPVPMTLGLFVPFTALECHAHAWDLGLAIGEVYQPEHPDIILEGMRAVFPIPQFDEDPWDAVLRFSGRSPY